MKAKSISTVTAFIGVAALSFFIWRQSHQVREARQEISKIEANAAATRTALQQTEQRLAVAEQQRGVCRAELDALQKQKPDLPLEKPAPAHRSISILEIIRNEPDAEAFYLQKMRSELVSRYGPLLRSLGLSAEAIAKFQDNYIRREETRMDLSDVLRTQGADQGGTTVAKLQAAADGDYENAQRALLGEPGYQQLKDYERSSTIRTMVSAIAGMAAVEHVSFTGQQADALVQAICQTSESYRNGGGAFHDLDWEAAIARAQAILTPEQFTVFRTMDPGPTRAGLLQTRMYALVERARQVEASGEKK